MRLLSVMVSACLLVGCQGPVEVRGLYVTDHQGTFLACDHPKTVVLVSDSTLAESYRRTATKPHQLLFVRLRGAITDSGSIYYSSPHLMVQQILEIRARREGECASDAATVPAVLRLSPGVQHHPSLAAAIP